MPVDPRAFREAIRTVNVSYAVPYLATLSFAFGLGLVGLSLFFPERMMPYILGAGLTSGAIGFMLIWYSVLLKPALLRSERHQEISRIIEIVGDKEQPVELRKTLTTYLKSAKTSIERKGAEGYDD